MKHIMLWIAIVALGGLTIGCGESIPGVDEVNERYDDQVASLDALYEEEKAAIEERYATDDARKQRMIDLDERLAQQKERIAEDRARDVEWQKESHERENELEELRPRFMECWNSPGVEGRILGALSSINARPQDGFPTPSLIAPQRVENDPDKLEELFGRELGEYDFLASFDIIQDGGINAATVFFSSDCDSILVYPLRWANAPPGDLGMTP